MEKSALEKAIERVQRNPVEMLTLNMGGKMECFNSLSSSVKANCVCNGRIKKAVDDIRNFSPEAREVINRYLLPSKDKKHLSAPDTVARLEKMGCPVCVCIFCYANKAQEWQDGARNKFTANGLYLSEKIREAWELPVVWGYCNTFRIEAEGDVINTIHAINYIRIMKKNPTVNFAVWTKNPEFWHKAFKIEGKPKNLINMILSSPYLNTPDLATFNRYNDKFPGMFNKIFTVYTKNYAKDHPVNFNCCDGSKEHKCKDCMKCYTVNNITEISEVLR